MSSETEYPIGNLPVAYSPPDERRFWRKVRRVVARVPFVEDLLAAWFCALDRDTPTYVLGSHLRPQHRAQARERHEKLAA